MTDAIAAMIPMLAATLLHFLWQGTLRPLEQFV